MDSYVTVGFVFKNELLPLKEKILSSILSTLQLSPFSVCILKGCRDIEGNNWLSKNVLYKDISPDDLKLINENYYGNILTTCSLLGISNQIVEITLYDKPTFFGYLIAIYDDRIKKVPFKQIEEQLINYIKDSFENFKFSYAFCDTEGEIEYSPTELNDEINYSVLVTVINNELLVKRTLY